MLDVDFGGFVCILFVVIVLFYVGFFMLNWIKMQEVIFVNLINNFILLFIIRICYYGLFYSYDCFESENGIFFFFLKIS